MVFLKIVSISNHLWSKVIIGRCIKNNTILFILFIAEIKKTCIKYYTIYTKDTLYNVYGWSTSFFFFLFFFVPGISLNNWTNRSIFFNYERDNRQINFLKSLGKWSLIYIILYNFRHVLEMRTVIVGSSYTCKCS